MQRIDDETAAQDLFGPGKDGFTGGNPETMIPATVVTAAFMNSLQEELARAVELGGVALNPASNEQLATVLEAIRILPKNDNRFTGLRNRFVQALGLEPGADLKYVDAAGTPTRRTRTFMLTPADFIQGNWVFAHHGSGGLAPFGRGYYGAPGQTLTAEWRLPSGSKVVSVRAGLKLDSGGYIEMFGGVRVASEAGDPTDVEELLPPFPVQTNVSTTLEVSFADVPSNPDVWRSDWHIGFVSFASATPVVCLKWVKVTVLDPGPINF